ncbi:hypothetical protein NDU88_010617 [Pleurodeles waltl]|uniref:Uncharacterized protein n=1 Tax=Pleurodeles waltl TaxID=8319 RepID=A0AAV7PVE2_PLEWA|nr:hypothetical protein NDU88_010617 [Pleurodeles waltl]
MRLGTCPVPDGRTVHRSSGASGAPHDSIVWRVSGPSHGLPRGPLQKRPVWVRLAGDQGGASPSVYWKGERPAGIGPQPVQPILPEQHSNPRDAVESRAQSRVQSAQSTVE